jgi:hypothetical protein
MSVKRCQEKDLKKRVLFSKTEAADGGGHIWVYIPCEVKTVFADHAYRKKENRELLVVSELVC